VGGFTCIKFGYFLNFLINNTHEDKAIPVQDWTDREGSRRLDFKTVGT